MTPQKVAILGGGVGAMTAAFYLTDQEDWQQKYDITVYQMGWRIGGKGASGRNAEYGQRIEEHGLHIWFGFYDNAFNTIKKAYSLLDRPVGAPLRTWQDAFKQHSFIALQEYIDNEWKTWPIDFPTNSLEPGGMGSELDIWDLFRTAYMWIKKFIHQLSVKAKKFKLEQHEDDDDDDHWLKELAEKLKIEAEELVDDVKNSIELLNEFVDVIAGTDDCKDKHNHHYIKLLLKRIRKWLKSEFAEILDENDDIRRLFISADLGLTILIGMFEDGVFKHGFNVINDYDYKEWLIKHGANKAYTVDSAPVRGFYDLVFAYVDGDFDKPNIEAGTIIRAMMRIALAYKGAVMWKMQAGMGDTIFTPFYQALTARGVKFEYFNKVEQLTASNNNVDEIVITQQVELKKGLDSYNPLVDVKGLECWPSEPKYDLLDQTQAGLLQSNNINLESAWTNWPEVYEQYYKKPLPQKILKKGTDFDLIIFGISKASLTPLCSDLLAQSPPLNLLNEKVKTVVTQAYQVWGKDNLDQLGWEYTPSSGEEPVLSGFVEPFDTWASMDQLLIREDWPAGLDPQNVSYFCSAMTVDSFPPFSDHEFPKKCAEQAKLNAMGNLKNHIYNLWQNPDVAQPGEFNWNILIDPNNQVGEQRFDSQFWRANIDPSEQYVLSVKNSSQYRLDTDQTGFDNFYITGDWIQTGLNVGCVEAATMAGMQTSRAICGHPKMIAGEKDFHI